MSDAQEEINDIITKIILQDNDTLLKAIIESFEVDTYEEPIFELCFKNRKMKCAKMIFDKGISDFRLSSCLCSSYELNNMTMEQITFLIEYCKVEHSRIPKEMWKKYLSATNKPEPKEKKKVCFIL